MERIPDKTIEKKVNENLQRSGAGGSAKISVTVRSGTVTLSGTLQYEMGRAAMLKAAQSVRGVNRVVDQLTVVARTRG